MSITPILMNMKAVYRVTCCHTYALLLLSLNTVQTHTHACARTHPGSEEYIPCPLHKPLHFYVVLLVVQKRWKMLCFSSS